MSLTDIVDRIIKSASNLNEIVLSPFMGSGTTAIVALSLQGQVMRFEIRADTAILRLIELMIF
ncbi:DNA methyltransferase [Microcoleus sp. F10-C6]|uniref:DNA methyltransferase n=1 Tax=unclassified Microcoleus TaxID=2642155 RepID=UPI002FD764B9